MCGASLDVWDQLSAFLPVFDSCKAKWHGSSNLQVLLTFIAKPCEVNISGWLCWCQIEKFRKTMLLCSLKKQIVVSHRISSGRKSSSSRSAFQKLLYQTSKLNAYHDLTHLLTRDLQLFARRKSSDEQSKQLLASRWSSCKRTKKMLINFSETLGPPASHLRFVACKSIDTAVT